MGLNIIFDAALAIFIVAVWAWVVKLVFDAFPQFPFIHEDQPNWPYPAKLPQAHWPFPRGPKP